MLIFGLCSTSDDWPSDLSDKTGPKCKKKGPLSYLLVVFCVIFWWSSGGILAVFCIIFIIIISLVTLTLSGDKEDNMEDCQKITQDCQKTTRTLPEDHQNINILVTLILSGGAVAMFYRV